MAKIAEQTERFEDMIKHMKFVVKDKTELDSEARNLLSVAYKNTVGSRRTAWRALSSIQTKEESKGSKHIDLLKNYKLEIEKELDQFCSDILNLIDNDIIVSCSTSESKVFFYKMKGDY
jgi:14-3-3 protein epsilon